MAYDNIDRAVDDRIKIIDRKLLEAFSLIKKDIKEIKEKSGKPGNNNSKEIEAKIDEIGRKIRALDNQSKSASQPSKQDTRQADKEKERMATQLSTLKAQLDEIRKQEEIKRALEGERKKTERLQLQLDAQKEKERILREEARRKENQDKKYEQLNESIANKQSELQKSYSQAMKRMERSFEKSINNIQSTALANIEESKAEKRKLANFYESRLKALEQQRQEQLEEIERAHKAREASIQRRNQKIEQEFDNKLREIRNSNSQHSRELININNRSENKFIALVKSLEDKRSKEIRLLTNQIYESQKAKEQEQEKLERKIKALQDDLNAEITKRERRLARQQAAADKKAGKPVKKSPGIFSRAWAWLMEDTSKPEVKKKEVKVVKEKPVAVKKDKTSNWIKWLIFLIPVLLIGYVLVANFVLSHDFTYTYDIGGAQDSKTPYLTPVDRVSAIGNESGITYRELSSGLVYFNVPIPSGADNITVQARIKNEFPKNGVLMIGAKNGPDWNYTSQIVYNTTLFNSSTSNQWIVINATFALKDLYISNEKLNIMLNTPHLGKNTTANYTIQVDWVESTVHKDGII